MPVYVLIFLLIFTACSSPLAHPPLKNTYWSLTELNGKEIIHVERQPSPHLLFHINDKSLHGSDGCNQLQGSYTQKEKAFSFEKISLTQMYCHERMLQAAEFLQVLKKTNRLKIEQNQLILFHTDSEIARFEVKEDY